MLKCLKCKGKMFVDRLYTTIDHIEIFCVRCGERRFFHPPTNSKEGRWILQKELLKAKNTIVNL
jgi:DNA-directed RNA polymerase subunit RPC12/RpoP